MTFTRRRFLVTAATTVAAAMLPSVKAGATDGTATGAQAARYRRHNVASPAGQRMLVSYARGVEAMLKLPANHPHNWFRNAYVHLLDCPHGNWWFYVWHRAYVGYFEQTIRKLSGDPTFAMPYWDWTQQPEIPASMFNGVLTPTSAPYEPFTGNLATFTDFAKPALSSYWNTLSNAQKSQLTARGYQQFEQTWNDITGYNVAQQAGISGNLAFAVTCSARYLSRTNAKLDAKTAYNVSKNVICAGLSPTQYYDPAIARSFTSSKTDSHLVQPSGSTQFSVLEGMPHNKVHNYIGGVGPLDPGPYGNMTNFLSPVDPIFFLHHSNMDRLWDVWTRKQIARRLPHLPTGPDLDAFMREPFLFFVDDSGREVGPSKAAQYVDTAAFGYDYAPGFGDDCDFPQALLTAAASPVIEARVADNVASLAVPNTLIQSLLAANQPHPLIAEITLDRPTGLSTEREFDVLVNAPSDLAQADRDSPFYAGTIAFFGSGMPNMSMSHQATFAVPLPRTLHAFSALKGNDTKLNIRLVPTHGKDTQAPPVHAVSIVAP